jgi:D-sedoheptulose 7-phosphate isomerase
MENQKDYTNQITDYIKQEVSILDRLDYAAINEVINVLETTRELGSTVYICGNGGSAATASHFVCDFNKGISHNKEKKYNFICLNDNIPSIMAIANDCGYEEIFVQQLKGKIKKDDVLLCISGSGNSKNIVLAAEYAKSLDITVIGATGYNGGLLYQLADYHLHVPVDNMQITEDIHMIFDHLIMWILAYGN